MGDPEGLLTAVPLGAPGALDTDQADRSQRGLSSVSCMLILGEVDCGSPALVLSTHTARSLEHTGSCLCGVGHN